MNYLVVIPARFKDASIREIIVQRMIMANGSVNAMFTDMQNGSACLQGFESRYFQNSS